MRELMSLSFEDKLRQEKLNKEKKNQKKEPIVQTPKSHKLTQQAVKEIGFQNQIDLLHDMENQKEKTKKWWSETRETDNVYASLAESEINQENMEKKDRAMYNKVSKAKNSIIQEMLSENENE